MCGRFALVTHVNLVYPLYRFMLYYQKVASIKRVLDKKRIVEDEIKWGKFWLSTTISSMQRHCAT
jgi:hypothetical protein